MRVSKDTLGEVLVPDDKHYGSQTQRSIENFKIGSSNPAYKMPREVVKAILYIKKAAAMTNVCLLGKNPDEVELKKFTKEMGEKIIHSVDLILNDFDYFYNNHFPLIIWQTGSGTQTNMNVNEVIASVANEKITGKIGQTSPVHPNDHVNLGQSSNDVFPTAMHVATLLMVYKKLLPAVVRFTNELAKKEDEFKDIVKIGRTHTQDATPVTLGQEFSAYKAQISTANINIFRSLIQVHTIAQGGTAVGTGINCPKGFPELFAKNITDITGLLDLMNEYGDMEMARIWASDGTFKVRDSLCSSIFDLVLNKFGGFVSSKNKFMSLATCDEIAELHGSLNTLAVSCMKIANDIRFLASGPRSGIGELILPENEPGSSIMPGKVNPTQCEALSMLACQVIGNNVAITTGAMQGHFELNVFRPMIIRNVLESIELLSDGINSFIDKCLVGIKPNKDRIDILLEQSLMLVTALNPYIGYDNSAKIAKNAHAKNMTLKESAIELGFISELEDSGKISLDSWSKVMNPKNLI